MKDRPILMVRWGRTADFRRYELDREFIVVIILAPAPVEEQTPGGYVEALVNAKISFTLRWPFVRCDIYAPDRWIKYFARGRHG
ncbi:MAG: hypothetical protein U9R07_11725 [Pseudomonadota bacterium]|nr:hypothetical protein [Pseudomonadota bacterium]